MIFLIHTEKKEVASLMEHGLVPMKEMTDV